MAREDLAVLISVMSAVIAGISLGWNIYRDLLLRARARVTFGLYHVYYGGGLKAPIPRFFLSVTNRGPGTLRLQAIFVRHRSPWRVVTRRVKYVYIMHDYESPLGGKLPFELEVGQKTELSFDPEVCKFLAESYTHIGVSSTLGMHWCARKDMVKAKEEFTGRAWLGKLPVMETEGTQGRREMGSSRDKC